jgi:hypothetical protein
MKHILLVTAVLFYSAASLFCQQGDTASAKKDSIPYWDRGGFIGLNFNQVSLTNWAQGGESSVSGTSILTMFLDYKDEAQVWDNLLDLAYGLFLCHLPEACALFLVPRISGGFARAPFLSFLIIIYLPVFFCSFALF